MSNFRPLEVVGCGSETQLFIRIFLFYNVALKEFILC